mgnify:CR=1 FL=1
MQRLGRVVDERAIVADVRAVSLAAHLGRPEQVVEIAGVPLQPEGPEGVAVTAAKRSLLAARKRVVGAVARGERQRVEAERIAEAAVQSEREGILEAFHDGIDGLGPPASRRAGYSPLRVTTSS